MDVCDRVWLVVVVSGKLWYIRSEGRHRGKIIRGTESNVLLDMLC